MSSFVFDSQEAAKAAAEGQKGVRVYSVSGNSKSVFVVAPTRELALARFSASVGFTAEPTVRAGRPVQAVSQRRIDTLIDQAAAAPPEEAARILSEVKTLRQQLEAKRAAAAAKRAEKKTTEAVVAAPAAPPAPPSPPAIPAPPAV